MEDPAHKKKLYIGLGSLQAFIGIGAVGGGLMLVIDPTGSKLGVPLSLLDGSPFPDFLIPGIFLFIVNGLGNLMGAGFSFKRKSYTQEIAIVFGVILVLWIIIQVAIIRSIGWLHILYFILGLVELGLGYYIRKLKLGHA